MTIVVCSAGESIITHPAVSVTSSNFCKVGSADGFSIELKSWLSGEDLDSYTVTNADGKIEIGDIELDDSGFNPVIRFLATGASEGLSTVLVSYSTETRSSCYKMFIRVIKVCEYETPELSESAWLINGDNLLINGDQVVSEAV